MEVTPVSGESWISHLKRPFNETSMGKTGQLGPAPGQESNSPMLVRSNRMTESAPITGADLYRFNCQGCHGGAGQGAPPEIHSVINPVRATSVQLVLQRMKSTGMDVNPSDVSQMAAQARAALLLRLHQGGESMPPFPHMSEAEISAILVHLKRLADFPAEKTELTLNETPFRIGEHIVKSTCHICHDATGSNPSPKQVLDGAIPPLEALTTRVSQREFIRKVTHGAPVLMGEVPALYRGRMPVFYYLSEEEAADVYLYLTLYPPSKPARPELSTGIAQVDVPNDLGGGSALASGTVLASATPQPAGRLSGLQAVLLLSGVYAFVLVLLMGSLGFTYLEFSRLSARTKVRRRSADVDVIRQQSAHAGAD